MEGFAIFDDSILGDTFPSRPENEFAERFRRHINETSDPLSFPGLSTLSPDKGAAAVLLTDFELSTKAEMVPCAICSSRSPKYRKGWLAWFEGDQRVRIIGETCGSRHLKDFAASTRRYRAEKKARVDRTIIEKALSQIPNAINNYEEFKQKAAI